MRTNKLKLARLACLTMAGLLMAACQNQATPAAEQGQTRNAPGAGQPGNAAVAAGARPTALPTRAVSANTSVAADGALGLAAPLISVSFESTGKVTALHVAPGQTVKQGDVLAELDGMALNTALQKAQESLALQQAQIDKSLAPATATDIASAKAALSSAYAAYNDVKAVPSAHDVEAALRSWNQAKNSLYSSQLSRDRACQRPAGAWNADDEKRAKTDPECHRADLGVQASEMSERSAYQKYLDAQAPATQDELTKAWASVVQAQASLATLQNGVSDAQKQVYALQLKQSRIAVERAQRDLAEAKLISPCDCQVQTVTLSVGASSDGGSVTLLDASQVQFQTTNLTEQDVVKLQAGQTATIRLKAFEQTFSGKVDAILPVSSGTLETVALFTVLIDLDPTDTALLPGMTGQAEINLK